MFIYVLYYTIPSCDADCFMSSLHQIQIPMTEGSDPVSMLTDDATVAQWNNEGLPGDKMSTQNATILTNCQLHPITSLLSSHRATHSVLFLLGVIIKSNLPALCCVFCCR